MRKSCEMCGGVIQTDDWYSFIRTKYCACCAKEVQRRQKAEWAKEMRRKTREANKLNRELCAAQEKELELLRSIVQTQRERIRVLEDKEE